MRLVRGLVRALLIVCCAVLPVSVAWAGAGTAPEGRHVMGVVRARGDTVQTALPGDRWRPLTHAAAVEGMRIHTGASGAAVLQLSDGERIGLAEQSSAKLVGDDPPRLRLRRGRFVFLLPPMSPLIVATPRGQVRLDPERGGIMPQEGEIQVAADGTTVVHAHHGRFAFRAEEDGVVTTVTAGEQATFAAAPGEEGVQPVVETVESPDDEDDDDEVPGAALLGGLGLTPMAALLGLGAVGAGLGSAAGAGAFSSDSSSPAGVSSGTGNQGSPFRPDLR